MKLDNVKAFDAMTPRIVAVTAQENMTLKNFYKNDTYLHFSRIPIYNESPEYITGYILLSDALEGLADDEFDRRLKEFKRPVSFFHDEDSLSKIWEELLKKQEQICLHRKETHLYILHMWQKMHSIQVQQLSLIHI